MIRVNQALCAGCGVCIDECPHGAIRLSGDVATVSPDLCDDCGACVEVCPNGALSLPAGALSRPSGALSRPAGALSRPAGALSRPAGALSRPGKASAWTIEPASADGQPVEIIPAGARTPAPRRRAALPAVLGALGWVGREVVPRLAPLALNALDNVLDRRSGVRGPSRDRTLAPRGRRGQRRHRRRRGRRS